VRTDRVAATQLASQLSERERSQAALLAQVSARRAKAQAALNAQQAYTDSLAPKVAKALDAEQKSSNDGGTTPPPPPATDSHAVTSATVQGRSGSYAVIVGQPKSYHPSGLKFDGLATWYGNVRPNMHTSSGRAFDERDFTCAHKSLPFGTRIAVTFRGHRVIVTVTDRGPYGKGRVIDLTKHAAAVIGLKSAGVGSVQCEVVSPD
jgi:rare lipoprotein A (peptidoglycan hydrolase)